MGASATVHAECAFDDKVFPKDGVKLSFIQEFFAARGGRDKLEGLTTTEVCEQHIKPLTASTKSSFCELLKLDEHPAVHKADVFVSHAWRYKFLDVVDTLVSHLENEPDIVIWFDLFSNNQHKATVLPYEWWCTTFKSAIGEMDRMIMVLSPFHDPIPYTRAWCIFEAYCCADNKKSFEIAMRQEEEHNFLTEAKNDPTNTVNKMLSVIDAGKSECFIPADKDRIFQAIRETVGFHHINSMLFEQFRTWVIKTGQKALDNNTDKEERLLLLNMLGKLYEGQGKYEDAQPLYEECVELAIEILGENHPNTKSIKGNYDYLLSQMK